MQDLSLLVSPENLAESILDWCKKFLSKKRSPAEKKKFLKLLAEDIQEFVENQLYIAEDHK